MPNNRDFHLQFEKKTAALEHLSETTCRDWFRRFKDGDFNVDDRVNEDPRRRNGGIAR